MSIVIKGKEYKFKTDEEITLDDLATCERTRAVLSENIDKYMDVEESEEDHKKRWLILKAAWSGFAKVVFKDTSWSRFKRIVLREVDITDLRQIPFAKITETVKSFFLQFTGGGE